VVVRRERLEGRGPSRARGAAGPGRKREEGRIGMWDELLRRIRALRPRLEELRDDL